MHLAGQNSVTSCNSTPISGKCTWEYWWYWCKVNSKQGKGHVIILACSVECFSFRLPGHEFMGELYWAESGVMPIVTDNDRNQLRLSHLYNTTLSFTLDIDITFDTTFRVLSFSVMHTPLSYLKRSNTWKGKIFVVIGSPASDSRVCCSSSSIAAWPAPEAACTSTYYDFIIQHFGLSFQKTI